MSASRTFGKILVVTSRDNFTWWSMQEIIPAIEKVWSLLSQKKWADVDLRDVSSLKADSPEMEELTKAASRSDYVVATASTPSVMRAMTHFRASGIKKPFLLYVHGDATSAFTSFGELKDKLLKKDSFVVSCEADARAVRDSFEDPNVILLPFPLTDAMKVEKVKYSRGESSRIPLLYVGRVSEQKNLHTLFLSIWILKEFFKVQEVTLDIFGSEDGYGSPNMDYNFPNYTTYLKGLSLQLKITNCIRWHGYKERSFLERVVRDNRFIFVSPTLHSDENFGSSALASMIQGSQVVITNWGGHPGFQPYFPDQLSLVPVHGSSDGPFLNPFELAQTIQNAHQKSLKYKDKIEVRERAKNEFSVEEGARKIKRIFQKTGALAHTSEGTLAQTNLLRSILDRKAELKWARQKLFFNYSDELSRPYFQAYGMSAANRSGAFSGVLENIIIPPWVQKYRNDIRVADPHRGVFSFPPVNQGFPGSVLRAPELSTIEMPLNVVFQLIKRGFAFPALDLKEKKRGVSRARQGSVGLISHSLES